MTKTKDLRLKYIRKYARISSVKPVFFKYKLKCITKINHSTFVHRLAKMQSEEQILQTICRIVGEEFIKKEYSGAYLPSSLIFYEVAQKFNIPSRMVY